VLLFAHDHPHELADRHLPVLVGHEHRNHLERQRFHGFHIHTATERYQQTGYDEDAFAEATDRFSDMEQATQCLVSDCNLEIPDDAQGRLF